MIATRPAPVPDARPVSPSAQAPRWLVWLARVPRLFLLACAGVLIQVGFVIIWILSYRLTHGNDFTYNYLIGQPKVWEKLYDLLLLANTLAPGIEPPAATPEGLALLVNTFVLACVLAGLGYLAAVFLLDSGVAAVPGALAVIVLFEVVYQVTLFLLPGLFTTDIFSYVMYGHISGIYNLNPYLYPPAFFPGNELLGWIHPIWHNQPTVYGPLWTQIGTLIARLTTSLDLLDRVFAYKVLMNVVQVANLALVWWLLGRTLPAQPRARLTAFTVFAWNPLMLFDVAGSAHNDALMVTLLLLGVVPLVLGPRLTNRGWLVGVLFVGLSALVKYTTALVGLFYAAPWARQLPTWRARLVWLGGAGLLVGGIGYVLFLPWLQLPDVLNSLLNAGSLRLYSNSVPDIIALVISNVVLDPGGPPTAYAYQDLPETFHTADVRFWMKAVTRGLFALYFGWEMVSLWRVGNAPRPQVVNAVIAASARAFLVLNLLVLTWVLEWYFMWPLALVTLLGWRRMLTWVTVAYTLTSLPAFYVHHYWSTNMPATVVLAYALPPLVLPVVPWAYHHLRARRKVAVLSPPTRVRSEAGLGLE